MVGYTDTPKIWIDDTGEVIDSNDSTELVPVEEQTALPTISEQKGMLAKSDLSDEDKSILGSLIEINNVANLLDQVGMNETADKRRKVIDVYSENFIASHLRNNLRAEEVKDKLLKRISDHIEDLDLELSARILIDLHQTMAPDVAIMNARSQGDTGMNAVMGNGPNINLTVNNATTDGASITNNTLAVNQGQPGQLKDITALNHTIKDMQRLSIPRQRTNVTINQDN